jgi:Flp pilus assembly protein TadD
MELAAGQPRPAAAAEMQTRCSTRASSLWNAGKIADAKKQFESAIAANPNHAESHYQLGMAMVNEGNLPGATTEFETYLKLAPEGPNAATAKGILGSLKK